MGIYLPTITNLIATSDVMKIAPDTWHGAEHLLKKYWDTAYSYQCTIEGYNHLSVFYDSLVNCKLDNIAVYNKEVGFVENKKLKPLLDQLQNYEKLFLEKSEYLKESLLAKENSIYKKISKIDTLNQENQKKHYLKTVNQIKKIDFYKIYNEAPVLKEISGFDLQDLFSPNYHPLIATAYWLKTQIFLVKKGLELHKSLLFIILSSC